MKKTLIAAAVMAASGVAFAASNVTLYGVIEEGVVVSKAKHKDTIVDLKAGFDSGNRWGIKGVTYRCCCDGCFRRCICCF
ncbi:outer membrane insertion signal domain protein [Parasutterella excrementihominis CAG:233]|nr:outer membrane insertion signal domain protein [Parasutterella excrementihominis CAG:233]